MHGNPMNKFARTIWQAAFDRGTNRGFVSVVQRTVKPFVGHGRKSPLPSFSILNRIQNKLNLVYNNYLTTKMLTQRNSHAKKQKEKCKSSTTQLNSPVYFPSFRISNNQLPCGASPHVCTDMKGHDVNPARLKSWSLQKQQQVRSGHINIPEFHVHLRIPSRITLTVSSTASPSYPPVMSSKSE